MVSSVGLRRTVGLLGRLRGRDWVVLLAVSALSAASPLVTLFIVKYLVDHVAVLTVEHPAVLTWIEAIWVDGAK